MSERTVSTANSGRPSAGHDAVPQPLGQPGDQSVDQLPDVRSDSASRWITFA